MPGRWLDQVPSNSGFVHPYDVMKKSTSGPSARDPRVAQSHKPAPSSKTSEKSSFKSGNSAGGQAQSSNKPSKTRS